MEAALEGARLRLRPILMTSFAFILGCVPLWTARGAGAAGRQILGTTVISGMLAATGLAIFIIPVLFVVVERVSGAERKRTGAPSWGRGAAKGGRVSRRAPFPVALVALAMAVAVGGCAVGPNYKRPSVPAPDAFYGTQRLAEAQTLADAAWWEVFEDPVLTGLVDEALRSGFDVRLAAARVEEARARYGIAHSELFPSVDYEAGWQRVRTDQVVNPSGASQDFWRADVGFSWELDLWGRVRRLNEAARAQYLATEEARRGVLLSLAAEVAIAYLDLRELDAELEISRRTADAFQDTYDLFNRRLEGGTASALETARAEAALGEVAAQIPEIERAIVARENQINFLLGRNPQPIPREGPPAPLPPEIPPGLPSALLERRPDIREAEQLLVAANANVGAAKAEFFPRLSLTGLFGNVSPELDQLFSQGRTWSVGAGLLGPLFQGGRIKRGHEAAVARYEQARSSTKPRWSTRSARSRARSSTGRSSWRPSGRGLGRWRPTWRRCASRTAATPRASPPTSRCSRPSSSSSRPRSASPARAATSA